MFEYLTRDRHPCFPGYPSRYPNLSVSLRSGLINASHDLSDLSKLFFGQLINSLPGPITPLPLKDGLLKVVHMGTPYSLRDFRVEFSGF